MEFFDTHCHIQSLGADTGEAHTRNLWSRAGDLTIEQVVASAQATGVTRMICVGCDLGDSVQAVNFAQGRPNCWASIGIHPHEANKYTENEAVLQEFANLVTNPKVVAIGECGLDYFYEHSSRKNQEKVLRFQIELALDHNLPLIFHVREAFDDFWPIFESYQGIRGVLHSFTDTVANMEGAVRHGLYIGVNGIATFTKDQAQLDMYKAIPLANLLLETDAPFLTPVPERGKVCEPKHVFHTAQFLTALRGEDLETLANSSTSNALNLFLLG